jgi:hypothetical protein
MGGMDGPNKMDIMTISGAPLFGFFFMARPYPSAGLNPSLPPIPLSVSSLAFKSIAFLSLSSYYPFLSSYISIFLNSLGSKKSIQTSTAYLRPIGI